MRNQGWRDAFDDWATNSGKVSVSNDELQAWNAGIEWNSARHIEFNIELEKVFSDYETAMKNTELFGLKSRKTGAGKPQAFDKLREIYERMK